MSDTYPNETNPTYEDLYAELQTIVAQLEQGDLPLAEALALYERGQHLVQQCHALLNNAELRVTELDTAPPLTPPTVAGASEQDQLPF